MTGPIDGDWVCIACEYPLRGLDPKGKCPECGTSIARSLRDDRLAHASPFWVFRLSQATTLLCFAALLTLIFEFTFSLPIGTAVRQGSLAIGMLASIRHPMDVLVWVGLWLLGTPEDVTAGRYRSRRWCWSLRVLATLVFVWLPWIGPLLWRPASPLSSLTLVGDAIHSLLLIATLVVEFLYLRVLARRLPDRGLSLHVSYVLAALVLLHLMASIVPQLHFIFRAVPRVPPGLVTLIVLLARGYAIVIFAKFSTRLTRAANGALENCVAE
jgi:hypothetical protein